MAKKVQPRFKPGPRRHFIKQWRKHRGLTQEQLAERIDVTPGTISQLELGRINYTQHTLELIADALQAAPGDLLNVDPTREGALWSIWEGLDVPARNQVVEIAKTFRRTGTEN
jgi:transcriptional regulator with XRE-family HTH domain